MTIKRMRRAVLNEINRESQGRVWQNIDVRLPERETAPKSVPLWPPEPEPVRQHKAWRGALASVLSAVVALAVFSGMFWFRMTHNVVPPLPLSSAAEPSATAETTGTTNPPNTDPNVIWFDMPSNTAAALTDIVPVYCDDGGIAVPSADSQWHLSYFTRDGLKWEYTTDLMNKNEQTLYSLHDGSFILSGFTGDSWVIVGIGKDGKESWRQTVPTGPLQYTVPDINDFHIIQDDSDGIYFTSTDGIVIHFIHVTPQGIETDKKIKLPENITASDPILKIIGVGGTTGDHIGGFYTHITIENEHSMMLTDALIHVDAHDTVNMKKNQYGLEYGIITIKNNGSAVAIVGTNGVNPVDPSYPYDYKTQTFTEIDTHCRVVQEKAVAFDGFPYIKAETGGYLCQVHGDDFTTTSEFIWLDDSWNVKFKTTADELKGNLFYRINGGFLLIQYNSNVVRYDDNFNIVSTETLKKRSSDLWVSPSGIIWMSR